MNMTGGLTSAWRKATYSGGQGACVEVAVFHDGAIGIRDSKGPEINLTISPSTWSSFLTQTKHGTYDL
jgi:hypothetical protein